ncbi:hypothetical protein ID866_5430 [Astraeus odoratus]|nr:hypothetical protein ID866_5430 [Astraeus odoratus]
MVSDKRLALIVDLISDNLNEEAGPVKGGLAAVNARVYAVKACRHRLLDVARETFKENVCDIMQLHSSLCEKYELPMILLYQESGFVFTLKKDGLEGELPKGFLNVTSQRGRWLFSSLELKKLNARMKDSLDETLILSNKIIQDLVAEILLYSGALYAASEAVALADLLWSFAHTSIMRNYVRPEFTGTLAVKAGRHPILETVQAAGTLVPNDIYCCEASHFQIVQGPKATGSMSGKSTYLRQTGLLAIMAMCGCFVPAEYASFRIHDALLARLSNDDDTEKNLSTFANEMTTSAMILGLATPKTLVLVDELGRGTATVEGLGIAHAIAEELIRIKRTGKSTTKLGMVFKYRVVDGILNDLAHYGLQLAALADLPDDVMEEGKKVAMALSDLHAQQEEQSEAGIIATHRRAVLRVRMMYSRKFQYPLAFGAVIIGNGGHINPPLYHDYEDLKDYLGACAAQHIIRFRLAHLPILRSVGEAESPTADCREVEAVDVYYDEETFNEAKRLLKVYKSEMPREAEPYTCIEGEVARKRYNLSELAIGCITTTAGAVHPYHFVTSIFSRLLEDYPKHFHLYTGTPCTSITGPSQISACYVLHTPRGIISASHVVHFTNAHVGALIPGLARVVTQVRETMSAQRPGRNLPLKMASGRRSYVFYDNPSQKSFDYLTQLRGGEQELMFGGGFEGDGAMGCKSSGMYDIHSAALVSGALSVYFGAANWGAEGPSTIPDNNAESDREPWAAGRVKALWSGEMSASADEFPWVGRVPPSICGRPAPPLTSNNTNPRMASSAEWVAAGYSGEGMVHAWLCARAVALMVLGMDGRRDLDMDVEGLPFGAGQTVHEWLPACYMISEARLKRASRNQNFQKRGRGTSGKMKVYPRR